MSLCIAIFTWKISFLSFSKYTSVLENENPVFSLWSTVSRNCIYKWEFCLLDEKVFPFSNGKSDFAQDSRFAKHSCILKNLKIRFSGKTTYPQHLWSIILDMYYTNNDFLNFIKKNYEILQLIKNIFIYFLFTSYMYEYIIVFICLSVVSPENPNFGFFKIHECFRKRESCVFIVEHSFQKLHLQMGILSSLWKSFPN